MSNHTEGQFLVCTPEEEEFFLAIIDRKEREVRNSLAAQRIAAEAIQAMTKLTYPHFLQGNMCPSQFGSVIYAAIRDGKIPGVVLGGEV